MNPNIFQGIYDNSNVTGKTRFYKWVIYKKKKLPVKTHHEKCLGTILLSQEKPGKHFTCNSHWIFRVLTRNTANMLEKIKSKNFLGNQILYLRVHFST